MQPYRIDVPDGVLDDLRARLAITRWPITAEGVGWDRGTDPDFLRELLNHWRTGYDWRRHEAELNELPQFKADGLHFVHQQAGSGVPLLLLHGWPDSFLRYVPVLPLLADHPVVIPSLPGYGFSDPAPVGRASRQAIGERVAELMATLGYDRYVVSAGDVGGGAAEHLAVAHPDRLAGLHLTNVALWRAAAVDPADLSPAERDFLADVQEWQRREGGYLQLQSTKPTTAAYGLADSPAGLAGWLTEKFRSWSDDFEAAFPPDELLTHLTLYWVTNTIGPSFGPYVERPPGDPARVTVPTAVSVFPKEPVRAPRELVERFFDVRRWTEHDRGGHFAALEVPDLFAGDLLAFLSGVVDRR
jgi:pimeloyl-ACP methyl ester carboxylesterase